MMDLSDLIARNAEFTPDAPAVRSGTATWDYAAFSRRIAAVAGGLASELGVRRGDRVAVLAHNHPDTLTLLYACARLGAILLPLNWRLAPPELAWILGDAAAGVLAVSDAFADLAPALQDAAPGLRVATLERLPTGEDQRNPGVDLATPVLLMYTSGTTGRPKGALLAQEALVWNGVMSQHMHALTSADRILTVLPLFHVGGLNIQTTAALHLGAAVLLHPRFDPAATLDAIARDRPTLTVLVPATMQALIEHPGWGAADLSSLRAVATGSTMVPRALVAAFEARGIPVLEVYGSTETCPVSIYTRLGAAAPPGSTGHPGLVCDARVVDDAGHDVPLGTPGEVLLRGPHLFREYWGNPGATADALRDGWFRTGDIGTRSAVDGSFLIHDRKKNLIVSGGENVYPAEVERVLLDHPAVAECAVIGRSDPRWQEVPVAYVVVRTELAIADLLAYAATQLARYKLPRDVHFVDALPRNALGKVQHFKLRQ